MGMKLFYPGCARLGMNQAFTPTERAAKPGAA